MTRYDTVIEAGVATPKNQQYEVAHNEQNDNGQSSIQTLNANDSRINDQSNKKTAIQQRLVFSMKEEEESAHVINFTNESNSGDGFDRLRQTHHSRSRSKHRNSRSKSKLRPPSYDDIDDVAMNPSHSMFIQPDVNGRNFFYKVNSLNEGENPSVKSQALSNNHLIMQTPTVNKPPKYVDFGNHVGETSNKQSNDNSSRLSGQRPQKGIVKHGSIYSKRSKRYE